MRSEAGAISVVYSLFVSLFITRTLKIREIGPILLQAVNSTEPLLFNLTIGNITPPLGYCMFITAKIAGIPVEKAIKGTLPYICAEILVLLAITYIPFLVTFIPTILGFTV